MSWHTTDAVRNPRVMLGTPASGFGRTVAAETRTYRDAKSSTEVRVNHARLTGLTPDTDYVYAAVHDGAEPESGTVRTAPSGRKPLRFTSFGDQSTPTLAKLPDGRYATDNIGSPAAADTTLAIERLGPLFNLVNGDLCYANLAQDRIRTWSNWFENNTRSARYRPWMPAAGNHENELGNGPIGYGAYQTYFAVPDSGSSLETRGLWYSFTAGSVRVISLNNDDVAFQDGGNFYVHGYSGGEQKRWLASELAAARARSGYRLDSRVHASDGDLDRRQGQRCRPGDPSGMAAVVRPVSGRSGGVRSRTPLRTVAPVARRRWAPTPERRYPSTPATTSSTRPGERCTSSSAAAAHPRPPTGSSSPNRGAAC